MKKIEQFSIIGIAIRTTNENMQSTTDIPILWNRFFAEQVVTKIPNKIDNCLYCMYTDFEGDYTKPYTTIIGCKVSSLEIIPDGMVGKTIPAATYLTFTAIGNIQEGAVLNEWNKIWNMSLDRAYTADFEIYGEKSQDPLNAQVDIFISINQ
ncbi:MAG: GyrI-like domain-containing protein [Bacteroidales bacterium]